ncbi:MAG: carboxypeptidase regulatory-like domain-containing protein [Saprospiraceae bacterium]|nr:carboxypeptidase regulatory-like domain-containing protein [Saprospiraceae bacterium]
MRQEYVLNLETYRVMDNFFDEYGDLIEEFPLLKEDVESFKAFLEAIDSKGSDHAKARTITPADKQALRTKIAQNIRKGLDVLVAQAIKDKNKDLKTACGTTVTAFMRCSEADFLTLAREEYKRLLLYPSVLDRYELTAAYRTAIGNDIETFNQMKPILSRERSKASIIKGNQDELFEQMKEFVAKVLPLAIEKTQEKYPDFAKEYAAVSTGKTPSVSPTKLSVVAVDESDNPIAEVTIESIEPSYTNITDASGKWSVKTGAKKEVVLKVSKAGFMNQEVTVKKIKRGQVTDVRIQMQATAIAA